MISKEIKKRIDDLMTTLPNVPIKSSITKSDCIYIQHVPEYVDNTQMEFIKLCVECGKLDRKFLLAKSNRQGIIGRYLDDSHSVLYRYWNRFMCIDELYREWSQPYFAFNFSKYDESNSTCINDEYPEIKLFYREIKLKKILENNNEI